MKNVCRFFAALIITYLIASAVNAQDDIVYQDQDNSILVVMSSVPMMPHQAKTQKVNAAVTVKLQLKQETAVGLKFDPWKTTVIDIELENATSTSILEKQYLSAITRSLRSWFLSFDPNTISQETLQDQLTQHATFYFVGNENSKWADKHWVIFSPDSIVKFPEN